jgi:hypothetical protein
MLRCIHYAGGLVMSVGASGRIVIEVEPELKRQLYEALEREGLTLKEWFLRNARGFLYHGPQLSLDFGEPMPLTATSGLSAQTRAPSQSRQPDQEARK